MPYILFNRAGTESTGTERDHVLLAHGAGSGIETPFFETLVPPIVETGISVTRFEFQYMSEQRTSGQRRPPPRVHHMIHEYETMIETVSSETRAGQRLIIGGKSLGGRVASLVAESAYRQERISGLICLGYPFHPPNKPQTLRTAHLETLTCPTLIVQGERDPFGPKSEVENMTLPPAISVAWIADGNHDFTPRAKSGYTHTGNLLSAARAVAAFLAHLPARVDGARSAS